MKSMILICGKQRKYMEMINFKKYIAQIKCSMKATDGDFEQNIIKFLVDNDWFKIQTSFQDEELYIDNEIMNYTDKIYDFFKCKDYSIEIKNERLIEMITLKYPDSATKLKKFFTNYKIPTEIQYILNDFILYYLVLDFCILSDSDIEFLLEKAYNDLPKQYGDILCFFLRWLKETYKVKYVKDYFMNKRKDTSETKEAYDEDEYLELIYYLFNEDYINYNEMYKKAALSKDYVDTWLFLSIHFICALRATDIIRIVHPRLPQSPEDTIEQVLNETYSDEDAKLALNTVIWRLNTLQLTPNKTSNLHGISSLKICIPESIKVHMGILFSLAEAHRKINYIPDEEPLIRVIKDYSRITRYMGEEIGSLFLESNFRSRSANKAYLQSIYMMTDDILENDDEFNVKGYFLAALARSHKGTYGEFTKTTMVYLKDAKLSGYSPEFVARELFERGVLSFIPSFLLKMITNGEYNKLPVHKQTELISKLDMTPNEVESLVKTAEKVKKQTLETLKKVFANYESANEREKEILLVLHRIGNGNAVSKQDECLCLMSALKKICPYSEKRVCVGCKYSILTKSTMFYMVSEFNRLLGLYNTAPNHILKNKYSSLIKETVLPAIDEMMQCIRDQYGDAAVISLEKIIKENTNAK